MTVYLGSAVVQGSNVVIQPPEQGFGGMRAARLTNYTSDAIILNNITGDTPGAQEYLMPFQQCVYKVENVRQPPTARGVVLGNAFTAAQLFVEWSDDPLTDFPGTYPLALTQAPLITAANAWAVAELAVPQSNAITATLPADPARLSLSFVNDGTTTLEYNEVDSGWGTNPQLTPGNGRTIDTQAAVYFRSLAGAAAVGSVQYFWTHY